MAEPLKYIYNDIFFDRLIAGLAKAASGFNSRRFLKNVQDTSWKDRELKQRMSHLAVCLQPELNKDYHKAVKQLIDLCYHLQLRQDGMSFEFMFIPEFISTFGQNEYQTSVRAFEHITQFTSCEFAVRPFLISHLEATMDQMLTWTSHEKQTVRRFSSEGCRPRLPWAMGVPALKKDPFMIFPILEILKDDPSEFVRRSVANNLNDISKDHPEVVKSVFRKWHGKNDNRNRLVKHAARTLLKQGDSSTMKLFGLHHDHDLQILHFKLVNKNVMVGNALTFSFDLISREKKPVSARLEYAIYFQLANGKFGKKVFKISETMIESQGLKKVIRNHSFRTITTRTYYPGKHEVSIIINGRECERKEFVITI